MIWKDHGKRKRCYINWWWTGSSPHQWWLQHFISHELIKLIRIPHPSHWNQHCSFRDLDLCSLHLPLLLSCLQLKMSDILEFMVDWLQCILHFKYFRNASINDGWIKSNTLSHNMISLSFDQVMNLLQPLIYWASDLIQLLHIFVYINLWIWIHLYLYYH